MPTRQVYMAMISNGAQSDLHPHVDLSGTGPQRVVVPCFSFGGNWITAFVRENMQLHGLTEAQVCVRLDNAAHITNASDYFKPCVSYWLTARTMLYAEDVLRAAAGTLSAEGVAAVARGVVRRQTACAMLAPKYLKIVRELAEQCEAEIKAAPTKKPAEEATSPQEARDID